ncbi:hypothetical protein ROLI_001700 [Roseobacter fucihabitans]|uniref:Uncharacterized protein n=1 Tax=Roseobacter fucihabitans TaxID=1537242 RepID=A0ABZ2BLV4_9RHOB|nr:Creatinase [Roseobacter litoralis]
MFVEEADPASLEAWKVNIAAHKFGMSLLQPDASCAAITQKINAFLAERDML